MPVVTTLPQLKSPPTNVFGLYQYMAQRLPGYDVSEYVRELNSAYVHVWEEIAKLKNHYFTNVKTVTVQNPQFTYDLMFNADNGLSGPISPRLYQVTKLRVQSPGGGLMQSAIFLSPNDPEFTSLAANPLTTNPQPTGPYKCWLNGRNNLTLAMAPAVGTTLEVTYTFWLVPMAIISTGTVSNAGTTVTGTTTNFTSIVQPDFQAALPSVQGQEEIQAELVCNPTTPQGGQIYRVTKIASDTSLQTAVAVSPTLAANSPYILATLPEIPREHIRVIAAIAMQKMYSVAGDDQRATEWTAIAQSNIQMMKDALIERQSNNPPRKIRFPGSIANARNRTFLR